MYVLYLWKAVWPRLKDDHEHSDGNGLLLEFHRVRDLSAAHDAAHVFVTRVGDLPQPVGQREDLLVRHGQPRVHWADDAVIRSGLQVQPLIEEMHSIITHKRALT